MLLARNSFDKVFDIVEVSGLKPIFEMLEDKGMFNWYCGFKLETVVVIEAEELFLKL